MNMGQYNNWGQPIARQWSQPQQNFINAKPQPINNLLRVTGPESAKAYSMPPNSDVVLFDSERPVFYWKSTDDSNFATLRTFTFEEQITESQPQVTEQIDVSSFVTKDDLDELANDINKIKDMLEGLVN